MVLVIDALGQQAVTAAPAVPAPLPSLAGASRDELRSALESIGVPDKQLRMRVNQLWSWIYVRGVVSFDAMSDISKDLRVRLAKHYSLERPEIAGQPVTGNGVDRWPSG